MPEPLRLGFLGCGRATLHLHLPALDGLADVRVVALADPDAGRRAAALARAPGARSAADWRDVVADPGIEAVAVCLPPRLHADPAIAAMDADRHVFIEKPLALTLPECDRIIDRARRSDRITMVGFNLRWHRLAQRARSLLAAGEIGPPVLVCSTFTSHSRLSDPPAWRGDLSAGGGVFTEIAVHHFDLWRHLLDTEVVEVSAAATGADEASAVWARLAGGALATGAFSDVTGGRNEVDVFGRRGQLHLSCFRFDGLEIAGVDELYPGSVRSRLRRAGRLVRDAREIAGGIARGGDHIVSYRSQWRAFAAAVRTGRAAGASLADGRRAVELALAAARSAGTGTPVRTPADSPAATGPVGR